jgi:hypothetical protein
MIRHVVMFKLKPSVSREERDRWIEMSRLAHTRIASIRATGSSSGYSGESLVAGVDNRSATLTVGWDTCISIKSYYRLCSLPRLVGRNGSFPWS